jgi:uncharacterized protein YjbI with pentapeptide repeats
VQYGLYVANQRRNPSRRRFAAGLALITAVVIIASVAWWLVVPAADWLASHDVGPIQGTELINARNNARGSLLTLGAGVVAAVALIFTARNLALSRHTLELTEQAQRRSFDLTEQGQVTDRYTKAIEQLGSDKRDVRIGGIYALERIALDSARDHSTVMEVLSTFVREHSREKQPPGRDGGQPSQATGAGRKQQPRADIQAAVTVIGRRNKDQDRRGLRINLTDADLTGADLSYAFLAHADLTSANLALANFTHADLTHADLTEANLSDANLSDAVLARAHLARADLARAHLTEAKLTRAHLTSAVLLDTHANRSNFENAKLTLANLTYANLTHANLAGANLTNASLAKANLAHANLAHANLAHADLAHADLTEAKLARANFSAADLTDANLTAAEDLTTADLTEALWSRPVPEGWTWGARGRLRKSDIAPV